jgi:hemerythrin
LLARYGGEELVALLPDTETDGAVLVGQRVVQAVYDMGLAHGSSDAAPVVTLSAGAASRLPQSPDDMQEAAQLLAQADAALYAAKHAGRNRVMAG